VTGPTHQLSWTPPADVSRRMLAGCGIGLLLIGAVAFGLSYSSIMTAAVPVFGDASWSVPFLMDLTILLLALIGIVLMLNGLSGRIPQWLSRLLVALTVYANVAPAHGLYARILHAAPPVVWVMCVAIAESTLRKLVGLADETRIEGLRKSLWLLRPAATWRLWRAMRIHQITTYRDALDRAAARSAVTGRLRLHHGRLWRWRAPLAERIALRLDGRDPAGVAQILRVHADTAALLSAKTLTPDAPVLAPMSDPAPDAVQAAEPDSTPDNAPAVAPVVWVRPRGLMSGRRVPRIGSRSLRRARTSQTAHTGAHQPEPTPTTVTTSAVELEPAGSSLPPRKRVNVRPAVVALRTLNPDMPVDTIAEMLGVHERTVVRHLSAQGALVHHANGTAV
jgi:Protein of unknown function (DUF2637)